MTISSAAHIERCPKCGSQMRYRAIKISTSEKRTILQCNVCRFHIGLRNEDK